MSETKTKLSTLHTKRIKRTHTKKKLKRLREEYPVEIEELWNALQEVDREIKELDPNDDFNINN